MNMFTLMYPTRIIFGRGALAQLGKEVSFYGKRTLLVSGRSSMRKTGTLDKASSLMKSAGVEVYLFDQVEPEPSLDTVNRGVNLARERNCEVIVGLGGGSAIDAAKAIASMVCQEGAVWDYHKGREVEKEGLPFIALPTTAGTGAEITKNAVLIDKKRTVKKSIRSPHMIAKVALVVPELTLSAPPCVTAYTGMDALTQAIESYISRASNAISDILALQAIELIFHNLPEAVKNGQDIEVREKLALGSLLSGMSFSNAGLGAVHGLAHPIGAHFSVPHGLACAVLLPYAMKFNLSVRCEKFKKIAEVITASGAEDVVTKIKELLDQIGIPETLKRYRISESDLPVIIAESRGHSMSKNPKKAKDEDLKEILEKII